LSISHVFANAPIISQILLNQTKSVIVNTLLKSVKIAFFLALILIFAWLIIQFPSIIHTNSMLSAARDKIKMNPQIVLTATAYTLILTYYQALSYFIRTANLVSLWIKITICIPILFFALLLATTLMPGPLNIHQYLLIILISWFIPLLLSLELTFSTLLSKFNS